MPEITIVYWQDIPAQVIVGKGRRAAKIQLPARFEQAIDRCAMKVGASGTDAYLAEWRKGAAKSESGDPDTLAKGEVDRLCEEFGGARLAALVENGGWDEASETDAAGR